jgi:protein-tyrosine phosphatase
VVCDGNHCRSPIGEALLRERVQGQVEVSSAGLSALEGYPADLEAQRLMAEFGTPIAGHRGRQLTAALAMGSDLIFVMDARQKADCERAIPSARGRVFLLGHWRPEGMKEIPDPYRRGAEAFRVALDQIDQAVKDWVPHVIPV